jgi:hypothetical protein
MRAASYFLRVWLREKELVLVVEIDDFVGKRGRHLRSGGQIFGVVSALVLPGSQNTVGKALEKFV